LENATLNARKKQFAAVLTNEQGVMRSCNSKFSYPNFILGVNQNICSHAHPGVAFLPT